MTQFNQMPDQQPMQQLPSSGKAVASLVLGIVSIPTCLFYGIPAIVCGILAVVFYKQAMSEIIMGERNPNSAGMAKAGMICGFVGLGMGVLFLILAIIGLIINLANM